MQAGTSRSNGLDEWIRSKGEKLVVVAVMALLEDFCVDREEEKERGVS